MSEQEAPVQEAEKTKYEMVYDGINRVSGNELNSVGTEWVFYEVKEHPIAQEHPELAQAVWEAYKRAVDNFWYEVLEASGRGYDKVWACGQVYGAAKVLAGFLDVDPMRYVDSKAQEIAERYQV